jgi:hypothetical protein
VRPTLLIAKGSTRHTCSDCAERNYVAGAGDRTSESAMMRRSRSGQADVRRP